MKPAVQNSISRTGNLTGEAVTMTVDATAMEHIMALLTDLYSDPELAVIREYSTNAWDSHVAAGTKRPIEISTPGRFSPFFKVKDYGLGLSAEDIRNIYSKYGASTKRDTNEQTGMLGLGCKSALTYGAQFTLTGVKDGIRTVVVISRNVRGAGVMEIIEEVETDEPNGVEVMIPVPGRDSFREKALRFFQFWPFGRVLINGEAPTQITEKLIPLGDNLYITKERTGEDFVVMGNVAYPVKNGVLSEGGYYGQRYNVVAYVNIGDVHFTPSREALHYTEHTESNLRKVKADVQAKIVQLAQEEIEQAETASDAMKAYAKWYDIAKLQNASLSWRGEAIGFLLYGSNCIYTPGVRNSTQTDRQIDYRVIDRKASTSLIVVDYDDPYDLKVAHRSKMNHYAKTEGYTGSVIVTKTMPGGKFTEHFKTVSWNVIKQVKLHRNKAVKAATEWDVIGTHGYVNKQAVADDAEVYYIERKGRRSFPNTQHLIPTDAVLVAVPSNRMNTFKKDFPKAVFLETYLRDQAKAAIAALTPEDLDQIQLTGQDKNILRVLRPEHIQDPRVKKMLDIAKADKVSSNYAVVSKWNDCLRRWDFRQERVDATEKSFFEPRKYPLLTNANWWNISMELRQHAEEYVNYIYSKENN